MVQGILNVAHGNPCAVSLSQQLSLEIHILLFSWRRGVISKQGWRERERVEWDEGRGLDKGGYWTLSASAPGGNNSCNRTTWL